MQTLVIKRDGSKEPFDSEKISRVLVAAGLEHNKAELVIKNISAWMGMQNKALISSLDIRDEAIRQLQLVDPYVAGLFRWYQKTKDTSITV